MIFTDEGLRDSRFLKQAGYRFPRFNREQIISASLAHPTWIHFGTDVFFRNEVCGVNQTLLEKKVYRTGVIGAAYRDFESAETFRTDCDCCSAVAYTGAGGKEEKRILSSCTGVFLFDSLHSGDREKLKAVFRNPSLQGASFTLPEAEYVLKNDAGSYTASYRHDFDAGPAGARLFISRLCALLYERYLYGNRTPLALVSLDSFPENGDRLQHAVYAVVSEWVKRELVEDGFWLYVISPDHVSYPWTYCDTSVMNQQMRCFYIEDSFPNGRPPLEKAGIVFGERDTVIKARHMKENICCDPLIAALAAAGTLKGYADGPAAMKDRKIARFIKRMAYTECLPAADGYESVDPEQYLSDMLRIRLRTPLVTGSLRSILHDWSDRIYPLFSEILRGYSSVCGKDADRLVCLPFVLAAWRVCLPENDQIRIDEENLLKPFSGELVSRVEMLVSALSGPSSDNRKLFLNNSFFLI
jgi:fructuronate reductase